jgi:hypothetical protein
MEPVVEESAPTAEPVETPSEQVPEQVPETVETPPKRGRGRPLGAKNRPKVRVVPLEPEVPEEPVAPEEPVPDEPKPKRVRTQAAQPKILVVPTPPPATPHETFRMAIAALGQVAAADRASKQAHYDAMVARMVK